MRPPTTKWPGTAIVCYRRFFDGFFPFLAGCFFCDLDTPVRLADLFPESAGISLGRTNIGSDLRSRVVGLVSRAICSSGSVSYRTPIAR